MNAEGKNDELSILNSELTNSACITQHSDLKKVPEIQFKGFSGEWKKYPLATFINSLDAGVSVNSGDRPANESEFGILKTSCVTSGFFEPKENKVVYKN